MKEIDKTKIKKIAVFNYITTTLGDSLYILPFIHKLKKEFPDAKIIVTGSKLTKDALGEDPSIYKFIEIKDLESFAGKFSRLKKIKILFSILKQSISEVKKEKADMGFVLLPNLPIYQIAPFLSKIPIKIGFSYPGSKFSFLLDKKTQFRNPATTKELDVHICETNLHLLELIGINVEEKDKILKRYISKEEKENAKELLKNLDGPFIAFQAGGRYKLKMWPPERFTELAKLLTKEYTILLLGSKYEFELCERIKKEVGNKCINLTNDLTVGTMAAILEKCKLIIGNDSGIAHIAASVGIQSVVLIGNSDPRQCYPFGEKRGIMIMSPKWNTDASLKLFDKKASKEEYSEYLLDINVKDVFDICDGILKNKKLDKFIANKKIYQI
ncbi:glycosyltransferase family 9 protein [Candidatus Woesearchaeota archaeon]|nr:glycosyltransferase family 9 protein [Candidatus Woesearchaeota archaeon]